MKTKLLHLFSAAILMAVGLLSCSKDQEATSVDQIIVEKQLKFVSLADRITEKKESQSRDKIIIIGWEEWGRKKKDCDGWGLCRAKWFPESNQSILNPVLPTGCASILEYDLLTSKYYFDILLANYPPAFIPVSDLALVVDEDILLDMSIEIGNDLVIKQGQFDYDKLKGVFGGFRIYLDKL